MFRSPDLKLRRVDIYRKGMLCGNSGSHADGDYAEWGFETLCRLTDQPFAHVKKGDVIQIRSQDDDESSGCWFKVLENPRLTEDPSTQGRWTFMTEDHAPIVWFQ